MKQLITAVVLLFFSVQGMAQAGAVTTVPQQSLAQKMARVFEPLDTNQLVIAYLFDQAPVFTSRSCIQLRISNYTYNRSP